MSVSTYFYVGPYVIASDEKYEEVEVDIPPACQKCGKLTDAKFCSECGGVVASNGKKKAKNPVEIDWELVFDDFMEPDYINLIEGDHIFIPNCGSIGEYFDDGDILQMDKITPGEDKRAMQEECKTSIAELQKAYESVGFGFGAVCWSQ